MSSQIESILNFLFVTGLMFGASSLLYRWLTGWSRLAILYAQRAHIGSISNGSYQWVGCKINLTSISISIEIYPEGLWLKPGFPLSIFMKSLLIPWSKIVMAKSRTTVLLSRKTDLQIVGFSDIFMIKGDAGLSIENHKMNK